MDKNAEIGARVARVNCDGKKVVRLRQFLSGMYLFQELFPTWIIIGEVGRFRETNSVVACRGTVVRLVEKRGAMPLRRPGDCQFDFRYHVPFVVRICE